MTNNHDDGFNPVANRHAILTQRLILAVLTDNGDEVDIKR